MNRVLDSIAPFRKALVPVGVAVILGILANIGISAEMSVGEAVTLLVTGGLVWLIPNRS